MNIKNLYFIISIISSLLLCCWKRTPLLSLSTTGCRQEAGVSRNLCTACMGHVCRRPPSVRPAWETTETVREEGQRIRSHVKTVRRWWRCGLAMFDSGGGLSSQKAKPELLGVWNFFCDLSLQMWMSVLSWSFLLIHGYPKREVKSVAWLFFFSKYRRIMSNIM